MTSASSIAHFVEDRADFDLGTRVSQGNLEIPGLYCTGLKRLCLVPPEFCAKIGFHVSFLIVT